VIKIRTYQPLGRLNSNSTLLAKLEITSYGWQLHRQHLLTYK